jgi:POT family proton-dependent oligopeptide transporter
MDWTIVTLIGGWLFVLIWIPIVIATNRKTHPRALFVLFFAEMWERFSYYGMRAILVLYMTRVLFADMEQSAGDTRALGIYGAYTAMVYLFPLLGGLIADRIAGFRRAVVLGGVLMMLGHFSLAIEGMVFGGNLRLFFLSLALIILGNGYFKPNISSFLGTFYDKDDPRKDGAFTIFYMGVNIGAFLSTMTCGVVAERISWHYGFGLAGIGMAIGITVFVLLGSWFGERGLPPATPLARQPLVAGVGAFPLVIAGSLLALPLIAAFLNLNVVLSWVLGIVSVGVLLFLFVYGGTHARDEDGTRLWVVAVLFVFHAVFWALFEQAGGSLTLFAERNVDRLVGGSEIPASTLQSFNPFYIIVLAPLFSWIWIRLRAAGAEPSTPTKFVLGLSQLALGFLIIVLAARFAAADGTVPLVFLALMYLLHTTGELSLSPVGLSMITKLSPARIVGFVMGVWFLSIAVANNMAGLIGQLTAVEDLPTEGTALVTLEAYTRTYLVWGVYVVFGAAAVLLVMVPILRRWMRGIH